MPTSSMNICTHMGKPTQHGIACPYYSEQKQALCNRCIIWNTNINLLLAKKYKCLLARVAPKIFLIDSKYRWFSISYRYSIAVSSNTVGKSITNNLVYRLKLLIIQHILCYLNTVSFRSKNKQFSISFEL